METTAINEHAPATEQERETAAFLKALQNAEKRKQIIELLKAAELLPLSPRPHD